MKGVSDEDKLMTIDLLCDLTLIFGISFYLTAVLIVIEFECEFCPGRYFKYKGDLRKHLQIHVGDNVYKCDVCGEGFRYQTDLRRHSYKHYKEDKGKEDKNSSS